MSARANGMASARAKARQRRAAQDQDRVARERRIEDAAAAFFVQADKRAAALDAVDEVETVMGSLLLTMLDEGEDVERVAELCEVDASDVRRWSRRARADRPAAS